MNNTQCYLRMALAHDKAGDKKKALFLMNAACVTAKLEMPGDMALEIARQRNVYRSKEFGNGQGKADVRR